MLQTHPFYIETDTGGDYTQIDGPFNGLIMQVRLSDTGLNLDTGCDILLETVGNGGVVIADWDNVGGSSWTRVPRIGTYDTGGAALGDQYAVAAHDRLRLTVNQSEGVAGSKRAVLFVTTGW